MEELLIYKKRIENILREKYDTYSFKDEIWFRINNAVLCHIDASLGLTAIVIEYVDSLEKRYTAEDGEIFNCDEYTVESIIDELSEAWQKMIIQ